MTEIQFYQEPIAKELLIAKIREEPTLRRIFQQKKDITEIINNDLKQRLNGLIDNFYTVFITGNQSSMKSSTGMEINRKFDSSFTAKRVSFQYDEHKKKLENSLPKQTFQLDEQVFQQGTGSQRVINEIQEGIETLRKRQNSLIICAVTRKYFPEELFTYLFETIDVSMIATCEYNKKDHEPRTCTCWEKKSSKIKKLYTRCAVKTQGRYIGFYITEINWGNEMWKEYSIAKDTFIEAMKSSQKSKKGYEEYAKELMQDPELQYYTNKKQVKIYVEKKLTNLTVSETELVVEAISMARKRAKHEDKPEETNEEIEKMDLKDLELIK